MNEDGSLRALMRDVSTPPELALTEVRSGCRNDKSLKFGRRVMYAADEPSCARMRSRPVDAAGCTYL
jgi:hypothetical protein